MAHCEGYSKLDSTERGDFDTEVLHIIMQEQLYFELAVMAVNKARKEGVFDNVRIGASDVYNEKPKDS